MEDTIRIHPDAYAWDGLLGMLTQFQRMHADETHLWGNAAGQYLLFSRANDEVSISPCRIQFRVFPNEDADCLDAWKAVLEARVQREGVSGMFTVGTAYDDSPEVALACLWLNCVSSFG